MNLFTKQKEIHRHRKQTYGYQRGWWEMGRGRVKIRSFGLIHTHYWTESRTTGTYCMAKALSDHTRYAQQLMITQEWKRIWKRVRIEN